MWFVKTSKQSVDSSNTALRCHNKIGPTIPGMSCTGLISRSLQRTHDSCTDSNNTLSSTTSRGNDTSGRYRHTVILFCWRFVSLQATYASMQEKWRNLHPPGDQRSNEL